MAQDPHQILADALERRGYDDWYSALLTAAIEHADGDASRAVAIAEKAFAKHPKAPETKKPETGGEA